MLRITRAVLAVMPPVALLAALAPGTARAANCQGLPQGAELRALLVDAAAAGEAGGLFHGTRMWGAVVNRDGEICSSTTSTADSTQVWPGSQAIAKHKAYTANAFSLDDLALSTARLYTFAQPGHSLFGLNTSNPFEPRFLAPPAPNAPGGGQGQIAGGIITFGGGVALYRSGKIVGGLGVSGDTACTDHEIAKKARTLAGMDPPDGAAVDDIVYSPPDSPSLFAHPRCINTWRNNTKVNPDESPAEYP